ncbi:MAG: hypothetical protein M1828_001733 [Chrysothrix sp. TS-e1954]|nr:MAG: hypothetical protein M1828_001733 [Chrysothrix sp. TS-e1954]
MQALVASLARRRRLTIWLVACLLLLASTALIRKHNQAHNHFFTAPSDRLKPASNHAFDRIESDLNLLIPATQSNAELCKTVITSLVLGYPTPTILNWGKDFAQQDWRANGTHIGKITGILDFLDEPNFEHQRDQLVLIIDGYDVWFQLRPDVLTSRYKEINRANLARTEARLGSAAVRGEGISQSILFSAQKNCGPMKAQRDAVACYAQPESPLRIDLYGPDTDILDHDKHLPLHFRPGWLNSGVILGPWAEMRLLMTRAKEKIASPTIPHEGSDQHIFNEIFGEQEYQRDVIRKRYQSILTRASDILRKVLGTYRDTISDANANYPHMPHLSGHPLEFGISLDYNLDISMSSVFSEFDGRFLSYNDSPYLSAILSGSGMPSPPRVSSLPTDVLSSTPLPFSELSEAGNEEHISKWEQVPLYTNVWTRSVPIMLHMNGFKSMRTTLWDQVWMTPHLREFFEARHFEGAKDEHGKLIPWSEMCGPFEDEIFRVEHKEASDF